MTTMVRERKSRVPTLFIPVTPELRRILALLVEAGIDILDEIDRPTEGLEADADFEEAEATEDDDPAEEDDPPEENQDDEGERDGDADLGWPNESFGSGIHFTGAGNDEEDFVAAVRPRDQPRANVLGRPPRRRWIACS